MRSSAAPTAPAWDGTWTVVLFSISEEQRPLRHVVRTRLTRLRFGMLYDGVWVRPGPTDSTAADMLQALQLQKATVLTTASTDRIFGIGDPINAFPLAEIDSGYKAFIAAHSGLRDRMVAGEVGAAEALRARAAVHGPMARSHRLPTPLCPPRSSRPPGPRMRPTAFFIDIHDGLAELADHVYEPCSPSTPRTWRPGCAPPPAVMSETLRAICPGRVR